MKTIAQRNNFKSMAYKTPKMAFNKYIDIMKQADHTYYP